jgi:PAS domain S-box-containing protein
MTSFNEESRLAELRRYHLLDTPEDERFDRITALAARIFDAPIAIVTLVDRDRIVFKSSWGLDGDVREIAREPGLCHTTILGEDIHVVTDAVTDSRTRDNSLVTGALGLGFYAGAPLRTASGHKLGALCIVDHEPRDFTEAECETLRDLAQLVIDRVEGQHASEALRESEQRLSVHLRQTPLAAVAWDLEYRVIEWNPAAEATFGFSRDEAIGRGANELIIPDQVVPHVLGVFNDLVSRRGGTRSTNENVTKDGRRIICEWYNTSLTDVKGELIGVASLAEDVSERLQAEDELARYRDQLEERVAERTRELEQSHRKLLHSERLALVGTLAAGIAHQINNPVGSILNAAEYALLCKGDDGSEGIWERTLHDNVEQARRCGRIVHSILQFSRGESTDKWVEDLGDLVTRTCRLSKPYAAERNAVVELSASGQAAPVLMSPIAMEQVVLNVIHNAIESGNTGVRVKVSLECEPERVCVRVRDNGRGLDDEQLRCIFDPFYTTRMIEGGTGLGLSVAHGIVVDHGGELGVESQPGQGTVVSIVVPLAREATA